MAQTYGQQPTQQQQQTQLSQPMEYTLPGVLHFIQSEWRRYERDRNEWEIERAEMKARIALLEGERRGIENTKSDLMRRVKMLEYALRQERSKYLACISPVTQTQTMTGESPTVEDGPTLAAATNSQVLKVSTFGLPVSSGPGSSPYRNLTSARDPKNRDKSRELLKACMQEIDYLTNAATNGGLNGTQPSDNLSDLDGTNILRKANRSSTIYLGANTETYSVQRKSTGNIIRPSRPAPIPPQTTSSSPPLEKQIASRERDEEIIIQNSREQGKNGIKYVDDEQSSPDSPNYEQKNSFASNIFKPISNGDETLSKGHEDDYEYESTAIYRSESVEEEKLNQGRTGNKRVHTKSAEEIKEEEEQLRKDVQKKFNLSEDKMTKLLRKKRSLENTSGSDPQLDELANVNFNVEDDENLPKNESDKSQENGNEQKMWRQRFTLRSHLDTVRSLSWDQSEHIFVSGSEDGTVKLWDLKNPIAQKPTPVQDIEPIITYRGHSASVNTVVMASEQRRCYSASMDATIQVWSLPTPKHEIYAPVDPSLNLKTYIGHADSIWDLRLFPIRNQNTRLLASASADGTVKLWNTEAEASPLKSSWGYSGCNNGEIVNGGGYPQIPTSVDFIHTDLKKIAVAYQNSIIKLFDIETGQHVMTFKSDETYDNTPATQINRIITHPTLPLVFSAHEDKYIRFFDVNSGQTAFSMLAHLESVTSLDVDPSGMILISGGHDSSIRLWDICNTKTCIQEFVTHRRKSDEGVLCVQYHPTLPWLASGGADSLIRIYC